MNNARTILWVGAIVAHVTTAVILVLLARQTPGMAIFCIVAGALIGCAGVPTVPNRPVTIYTAFGVLMGFVFWVGVSAINQRSMLDLLLVLPLAVGAVWLLKQPCWPSTIFSAAAVLLMVLLGALQLKARNETGDVFERDRLRRSALVSVIVPGIGLVHVGLGFAQFSLGTKRKKRRRRHSDSSRDEE